MYNINGSLLLISRVAVDGIANSRKAELFKLKISEI